MLSAALKDELHMRNRDSKHKAYRTIVSRLYNLLPKRGILFPDRYLPIGEK